VTTTTLDDAGNGTLTLNPSLLDVVLNPTVGFQYVAGDAVGPATSVPLSDLL